MPSDALRSVKAILSWTLTAPACALLLAACASHRTTLHEPAPRDSAKWNTYSLDNQATLDAMASWPSMTASDVLAGAAGTDGAVPIVVEGRITKVCETMGCWLEMDARPEPLLVMMRDHEYFVPRNATGVLARAYGRAVSREQSVEVLQHLAADAGASASQIEAITKPRTRIVFIADAVAMPPDGLDRPAR